MNLFKVTPDFDYNLKFTDVQLVKINELAKSYANIDFERGTVSVFSEMAMFDSKFNGYIKPLTKNMKIFKLNEREGRSVGKFFTELLAQAKLPKRKLVASINKLASVNHRLKPECELLKKTLRTR